MFYIYNFVKCIRLSNMGRNRLRIALPLSISHQMRTLIVTLRRKIQWLWCPSRRISRNIMMILKEGLLYRDQGVWYSLWVIVILIKIYSIVHWAWMIILRLILMLNWDRWWWRIVSWRNKISKLGRSIDRWRTTLGKSCKNVIFWKRKLNRLMGWRGRWRGWRGSCWLVSRVSRESRRSWRIGWKIYSFPVSPIQRDYNSNSVNYRVK